MCVLNPHGSSFSNFEGVILIKWRHLEYVLLHRNSTDGEAVDNGSLPWTRGNTDEVNSSKGQALAIEVSGQFKGVEILLE